MQAAQCLTRYDPLMQPPQLDLLWLAPDEPFPADIATRAGHAGYPGLIAAGGNLSVERLITAYTNGLFPWYSEKEPILWWSPPERMVLKVDDFQLHRSLKQSIKRFLAMPEMRLVTDTAFAQVMQSCAGKREGQRGTWISDDILNAYVALHRAGYAHSFELWLGDELVAGLYGVNIGRMFYGESMFTHVSDGSKTALFALVCACRARGVAWIDCQQETEHLASMGARPVSKPLFIEHLQHATRQAAPVNWAYDDSQLARDIQSSK
jgi:leucyl/phenylalanyl-tRNA--protein transferase